MKDIKLSISGIAAWNIIFLFSSNNRIYKMENYLQALIFFLFLGSELCFGNPETLAPLMLTHSWRGFATCEP